MDPLASLVAIAAVLANPGPTNALLAAAGAARRQPAAALLAAELAGYAIAVTALRLAGAPVLAAVPALVPALRLGLAAYLVVLGCCLWRHDLATSDDGGPITPGRIFVTTLFNPKAAVFAFALFPETVPAATLVLWAAGFAVVVPSCGGLWFLAGDRVRRLGGAGAARLLPRLASLVLIGFAALIAGTTLATLV